MYRITRAVNMLSDFTQFHVIFRQYCTPSTDFSEELHDLFSEFLKAEEHRHFSESTMKQLRGRLYAIFMIIFMILGFEILSL